MPKRLEDEIQKATVKYLRLQYPDVLICAAVPEARGGNIEQAKRAGAKAKAMGYTAGWPDLMVYKQREISDVLRWNCCGLAIEFKTAKGVQSTTQKEVERKLKDQGWSYHICRSFDEAKEIIDEYLK